MSSKKQQEKHESRSGENDLVLVLVLVFGRLIDADKRNKTFNS